MNSSHPSFDEDLEKVIEQEVEARRVEVAFGISRYIGPVCLVIAIALVGVWLSAQTCVQILIYALLIGMIALGAGMYPFFQRRDQTRLGILVINILSIFSLLLTPLLIHSLMPVIAVSDVIVVIILYLLLGDRDSRWLVAAVALVFVIDVILVSISGWSLFPPLSSSTERWITGIVSLIGFLIAILIIRLIVLGLERQYRRTRTLNFELQRQIQAVNETKETLNRERNLLRLLIDTVPANVYIKDIQSRFVDANVETAHQMGAKTPNDLLGKTDFDFFSPEFARKYFADEQALIESGLPLRNVEEASFDPRTQRECRFLTTKVPIVDEQGAVTGLVGVGLDITDQTYAREQIAQERDLLRTLIDHIPDYIFIKDVDGRFVNSNAAHNRIAHVQDASELLGKTAFEVFPESLAAQFDRDDQRTLQTGQALVNVERKSINFQGEERIVLTTEIPLRDVSGNVTGLVGISRDITEHKQAEQQSQDLRNERERVQILHQFIGDATHDLMTPITGINLSVDLARRAPNQERLIAHLGKIDGLSEALQNRLQDMLMLSELDMMTTNDLKLSTVDLVQDLETAYRNIPTHRASQKSAAHWHKFA